MTTNFKALEREYEDPTIHRELIVGRYADVQPEDIHWLWPGRLPLGKLCIIDGDPGLGKSLVTLDLAARVSTGRAMPGERESASDPAPVLLLSAEDGPADTIRPRLDALNADAALIHAVTGVKTESRGDESVTLPLDIAGLEVAAKSLGARLIVIDPFMAFIGADVNTRVDHDVRRLLSPLSRLAERSRATVLVVRHLNKSSFGSAIYRGGGSIAFIGAARAGLLVARDPNDSDKRVLAVTKMNLSPEPPSVSFMLERSESGAPRVRWLGESHHRANDLVSSTEEPQEAGDLKTFLRELLEAAPRTFPEVRQECRKAGFEVSDRSLRNARQAAGIAKRRRGFGPGSVMVWSLNDHTGSIPVIPEDSQNASGMATMGQYGDPDHEARLEMSGGA